MYVKFIFYIVLGFFLRKKLVIVMLTDVLCLGFGMIISKLIEKPCLLSQF